MRKPLAVLALALGAIVVTPAAALAAPVVAYEVIATPGTVSTGTVVSGGSVEFCGGGFEPGSGVTVAVDGDPIGTVEAEADGTFCVDIVLTGSGAVVLSAAGVAPNGDARVVTASVTLTSTAAAPVRNGGSMGGGSNGNAAGNRSAARSASNSSGSNNKVSSLPRTGAEGTATQVWAGVGLLGLGGGLVALTVARRRETPDAA